MSRFRRNMALAGLGGLLVCGLLAAFCAWLVIGQIVPPLLPYRAVALLFAAILGGFSLAEIPVMVFAMRRLAAERPDNYGTVWSMNGVYVFFAAVYGLPVLLLTGSIVAGLVLCGLSLLRYIASLLFVREAAL